MLFNHVALVCSSERHCDHFYQKVLGLDKLPSKVLSAEMSKKIFDRKEEYPLIYYGNEAIKFEIFLSAHSDFKAKRISHTCLEIEERESIFDRCASEGFDTVNIPREGSSDLLFVKDHDGNLFELKEKP